MKHNLSLYSFCLRSVRKWTWTQRGCLRLSGSNSFPIWRDPCETWSPTSNIGKSHLKSSNLLAANQWTPRAAALSWHPGSYGQAVWYLNFSEGKLKLFLKAGEKNSTMQRTLDWRFVSCSLLLHSCTCLWEILTHFCLNILHQNNRIQS